LGTYLTLGQIVVNPAKVTAISEWPVPQKLKDVESFLSTINFWWKFIKDFSMIAHLLHELKKKDVPVEWTEACQDAFDALKRALATAPILKIPWENLPYLLETDASGFALGAVLSQCHDGKWYPIDFHSWSLIPAEQNYPTHDQELLVIINSFKKWKHLLEGAKHDVLIRTDNMALKYFMMSHSLSHRQVCWSQYLLLFRFKIEYATGKRNKADGLSWCPDYEPDLSVETDKQVLIPPEYFINTMVMLGASSYLECLWHRHPLDKEIAARLQDPDSHWNETAGVIHDARGRIIVPSDAGLRTEII
jgi:hypothetical protein